MGANANVLIPDHIESSLNNTIQSYLKKLKQQVIKVFQEMFKLLNGTVFSVYLKWKSVFTWQNIANHMYALLHSKVYKYK